MNSLRSLRQLIFTYLQSRRGLPTPRAASDSIAFYGMFVAAVAGMAWGMAWLPRDAEPTRTFLQPIAFAIGAAVVVYGCMRFLDWCFGFVVLAGLADLMAGASVGLLIAAFWAGLSRRSPPEWTNWFPLIGALCGWAVGSWLGRGQINSGDDTMEQEHRLE